MMMHGLANFKFKKELLPATSGKSSVQNNFGGVSDLCHNSVGFTSNIVRHGTGETITIVLTIERHDTAENINIVSTIVRHGRIFRKIFRIRKSFLARLKSETLL
jgi:hypothetical protein